MGPLMTGLAAAVLEAQMDAERRSTEEAAQELREHLVAQAAQEPRARTRLAEVGTLLTQLSGRVDGAVELAEDDAFRTDLGAGPPPSEIT